MSQCDDPWSTGRELLHVQNTDIVLPTIHGRIVNILQKNIFKNLTGCAVRFILKRRGPICFEIDVLGLLACGSNQRNKMSNHRKYFL